MKIDETTFKKMPPELRAMFNKLPNPGSDEVKDAFPSTGSGSAARFFNEFAYTEEDKKFFYSGKANKADRNGSKHPTVKPIKLMEWLVRMVTPPGGTTLDMFAGSGTTGQAALNVGVKVILIEREDEYVEDIKRRFEKVRLKDFENE